MNNPDYVQNEMRSGEHWQTFLKEYKLTDIHEFHDGTFEVVSNSGSTYHIQMIARMDKMGSYYTATRCNCAARKQCRHIDAVVDMLHAEAIALALAGNTEQLEYVESIEF